MMVAPKPRIRRTHVVKAPCATRYAPGCPGAVAMQMTGHKTRAVFERYNIVSPGDLRDAAHRLDRYVAGGAS